MWQTEVYRASGLVLRGESRYAKKKGAIRNSTSPSKQESQDISLLALLKLKSAQEDITKII